MGFNLKDYPANWQAIRAEIFKRSRGRCECTGECGFNHGTSSNSTARCPREQGHQYWTRLWNDKYNTVSDYDHRAVDMLYKGELSGVVVLTLAHTCWKTCKQGKKCARRRHLKQMCQRCHLACDREQHNRNAALTRLAKKIKAGQLLLKESA